MACRLFGAKSLSEPMLPYYHLDNLEQISVRFNAKYNNLHRKMNLRMPSHILYWPRCVKLSKCDDSRRACSRLYGKRVTYDILITETFYEEVISLIRYLNRWSFTWWRHQMEIFSAILAICAGNSPVPGDSSYKGHWRGALMFSLICIWINGWVNNRKAGDLRRYRAHYDVTIMHLMKLCVEFNLIIYEMNSFMQK